MLSSYSQEFVVAVAQDLQVVLQFSPQVYQAKRKTVSNIDQSVLGPKCLYTLYGLIKLLYNGIITSFDLSVKFDPNPNPSQISQRI